jgi:hypothetical protein
MTVPAIEMARWNKPANKRKKTKRKNHEETKEGEKPLMISRCRQKDNIKMDLREI